MAFTYTYGQFNSDTVSLLKRGGGTDSFTVIYIESGEGRLAFPYEEISFLGGSLMLISGAESAILIPDTERLFGLFVSFSREDIPPDFSASLFAFKEKPIHTHAKWIASEALLLIERICRAAAKESASYVKLLTLELLLILSEKGTVGAPPSEEKSLGVRVENFLSENLDTGTDLDSLARRFFVSKYYLCRAFKRHTGMTVHSYITERRLVRARELIRGGEAASSVAYKVGFGDYSAFYRAYVKLFGSSPTEKNTKGREHGI